MRIFFGEFPILMVMSASAVRRCRSGSRSDMPAANMERGSVILTLKQASIVEADCAAAVRGASVRVISAICVPLMKISPVAESAERDFLFGFSTVTEKHITADVRPLMSNPVTLRFEMWGSSSFVHPEKRMQSRKKIVSILNGPRFLISAKIRKTLYLRLKREVNMNSRVFVETYGCQMNVYDSELVMSILARAGYETGSSLEDADVILVNTCSIRENAEQRVYGRLDRFLQEKKKRPVTVGVLGCMAEHLKEILLEHPSVDLVAGPDAYRRLPEMLGSLLAGGKSQIDVLLSKEETYADILPVKDAEEGVTAFISIMRGCNNMCTYCIVPYVRGRERSRDPFTIVEEARGLYEQGFREVNLLGQNVDSYLWKSDDGEISFADLLKMTAEIAPDLRVRFSTSHPKDMSDDVISVMAAYPNICKHIHLPVQSGSDRMLAKMNRKYDRARYMDRIHKIREIIPEAAITTDVIAGFCTETEEEHRMTMSLMEEVQFDSAFMFQYSERPDTLASRHFPDDIPLSVKTRRLNEIIDLQNGISLECNRKHIGRTFTVLVEGTSKRNKDELFGRTSGNKVCVFPAGEFKIGDYAEVTVTGCTSATLICSAGRKVIHD